MGTFVQPTNRCQAATRKSKPPMTRLLNCFLSAALVSTLLAGCSSDSSSEGPVPPPAGDGNICGYVRCDGRGIAGVVVSRRRERRENRRRGLLLLYERPRHGRLRAHLHTFGLRNGPRRHPSDILCGHRSRRTGHSALRFRPDRRGQHPPPAAGHGRRTHLGTQTGLSERQRNGRRPNSTPSSAANDSSPRSPPTPLRLPRATASTG